MEQGRIPAGTSRTGQEIPVPPDLREAGTGRPEEPDVPVLVTRPDPRAAAGRWRDPAEAENRGPGFSGTAQPVEPDTYLWLFLSWKKLKKPAKCREYIQ
jgi:hypothetical protein